MEKQDTVPCLLAIREGLRIPPKELDKVAGEREVRPFLLKLLRMDGCWYESWLLLRCPWVTYQNNCMCVVCCAIKMSSIMWKDFTPGIIIINVDVTTLTSRSKYDKEAIMPAWGHSRHITGITLFVSFLLNFCCRTTKNRPPAAFPWLIHFKC